MKILKNNNIKRKKNMQTVKNILLGKNKTKYHFHFVGVGGVSMFSLAVLLHNLGQEVTGSDTQKSQNTKKLEKLGIKVHYGHKSQNVEGCNFVIYSYACKNCVEVKKAQELKILCLPRAKLLGQVLKCYNTSICIAGAHGKSTTTALIFEILKTAGLFPSLHLGANLTNGESYCYSNSNFMVCEACEYNNAFLHLKPQIAIILNIEAEHLDFFKTFNGVKRAFFKFAKSANMLICESSQNICHPNKITFGKNGNFELKNLKMNPNGTYCFSCFKNGKFYGHFNLNLVGIHNAQNALSAIAVAHQLGIEKKHIKQALANFAGIERRFQYLNSTHFVVHDYAHHPSELSTVISEVKKFYKKELLIVFQPHTYTRTKNLFKQFVSTLLPLKHVVIYKTYSAREKYIKSGSAKRLAQAVKGDYIKTKNNLKQVVLNHIKKGNGVLFLGAGNIYETAKRTMKEIKSEL